MEKVLGIVKKVYLPDEKRNGEPVLDLYKTDGTSFGADD